MGWWLTILGMVADHPQQLSPYLLRRIKFSGPPSDIGDPPSDIMEGVILDSTGCLIMNATKVFSNNFYSKAPYELILVPYFH